MRKIKEHRLTGIFDHDKKMGARDHFEKLVREQIMEQGYVPVLDRDTLWFTHWDEESDHYEAEIVISCIYVGTKKAREEIAGWNEAEGKWVGLDGHFQ